MFPRTNLKACGVGHMLASGRTGIAMQIPLTSCPSSSQKTKQNKKHNEEAEDPSWDSKQSWEELCKK